MNRLNQGSPTVLETQRMNRKQRRAMRKQSTPVEARAGSPDAGVAPLFAKAVRHQQQNQHADAMRAYKRLLLLEPDHAEAVNNLACLLQAQGRLAEASAQFARTIELTPQLVSQQFGAICATLAAVLPPLGEAMRRATEAWPQRPPPDQWLGGAGLAAIAADPLLLTILRSGPVRDVALERALTGLRAALLDEIAGGAPHDDTALAFCCMLARQCFINEYVFATTPNEESRVERIKADAREISPMRLAAIAMYMPLHALPYAQDLLDRAWPRPVDEVVTQQLREPMRERALRDAIPRPAAIDDDVSRRVRRQYEENPYPRWVDGAGNVAPVTVDAYLRATIPGAVFAPLGTAAQLDVLVAGCGTGSLPIELAKKLSGVRVFAIDLSLASLAYAMRKTPAALADRLSYAQADILQIGTLGRGFDVVDASGVLHHMADPKQGLRALLAVLRPGGLMHLGLYSEIARRNVTAARNYLAEKGYQPTTDGIRRARQDILDSNLRGIAGIGDFFTTSECRDLLFHVQEHQLTIPKIKSLLTETGLNFIGFVFDSPQVRRYAALFARSGASTVDLDAWHAFEMRNPDMFSGMYQFWVQKPGA